MQSGEQQYRRLKAHLVLKEVTLTEYALSLGVSQHRLRSVVENFAGGPKLPRDALSRKLLVAVEEELRAAPFERSLQSV